MKTRTIKFTKIELELLIKAMDMLYDSGLYEDNEETSLHHAMDLIRNRIGAFNWEERHADKP